MINSTSYHLNRGLGGDGLLQLELNVRNIACETFTTDSPDESDSTVVYMEERILNTYDLDYILFAILQRGQLVLITERCRSLRRIHDYNFSHGTLVLYPSKLIFNMEVWIDDQRPALKTAK